MPDVLHGRAKEWNLNWLNRRKWHAYGASKKIVQLWIMINYRAAYAIIMKRASCKRWQVNIGCIIFHHHHHPHRFRIIKINFSFSKFFFFHFSTFWSAVLMVYALRTQNQCKVNAMYINLFAIRKHCSIWRTVITAPIQWIPFQHHVEARRLVILVRPPYSTKQMWHKTFIIDAVCDWGSNGNCFIQFLSYIFDY